MPGTNVITAVQLDQLLAVVAEVQIPLFNEQNTLDTATLSWVVPFTVKVPLLTLIPAVTLVMLRTGGMVSAVTVRVTAALVPPTTLLIVTE